VESVEAAAIADEPRALLFEHLPDRLFALFGMGVRLGPDDAFVDEPGVQFAVALDLEPRREEALAHEADLVLDLALLPACRRRAGDRLDEMVRAHLEEAAIVLAVLADEDRVHRRLHVVVDSASAGALEKREAALVRVEHHLLRLARIGAHEHHAAVAEPHVGDLHLRRHPVHDDDLVRPVELVGFARRKRQGDVGFRRRARVLLAPAPRIAANRVVAALVAERTQLLVDADQRQPLGFPWTQGSDSRLENWRPALIRVLLNDAQWARIAPLLPGMEGDPGRSGEDNRRFLEAVLWIVRAGAPWRDLPNSFGKWSSVWKRFRRWAIKGVFERIYAALSEDPDFEYALVDGTIVKVHRHGAGAKGGLKTRPSAGRAAG